MIFSIIFYQKKVKNLLLFKLMPTGPRGNPRMDGACLLELWASFYLSCISLAVNVTLHFIQYLLGGFRHEIEDTVRVSEISDIRRENDNSESVRFLFWYSDSYNLILSTFISRKICVFLSVLWRHVVRLLSVTPRIELSKQSNNNRNFPNNTAVRSSYSNRARAQPQQTKAAADHLISLRCYSRAGSTQRPLNRATVSQSCWLRHRPIREVSLRRSGELFSG